MIETKPETSGIKPWQSNMIETKMDELRKHKRRPYCCNLLQFTKIKQMKNQPKSIRKQKTTTLTSQTQGNALDSNKPVKMNKGKHYVMKDKVIRKNKKRTTKAKKIICNYRKLKNETNFMRKPNFNIFLTREFLDSLSCQIERDFKFQNQHEKQILLFTEFTNKKNKNKVWDCMREYVRSNAVRLKDKKVNDRKDTGNQILDINEEPECNEIVESENTKAANKQINNSIVINNESSLNNQITSSRDKQINETNHNNQITNSIDKQSNENSLSNQITNNTIDKQINENSHNNQITNSIDMQINETSHSNQITNTKKLKRLEKKRQKRQSGKLDETIVANKARGENKARGARGVVGEDNIKLDLNKIVDAVVRKGNVDELCVVKQQIHSRNFRPYCNQLPMPRLRKVSTDLIKQIVLFQERLFKSDPLKGRTKRRYLVGVKEVLKSLPIRNKVKILFIAPDLECVPLPGGIDDDIQSLLTMATIQGVPYLFSLSRRLLGSLTHKPATSCLAVLDYSGTEEMVDEIFSLIAQARTMYDDRVLSLSNSLSSNKTTR
uniref:Selenocysteine insertion sequence-binding protein 2-like n=1 Tax=Cacopsylla melanoneura TaxID=428564 RepID=A0A8D8RGU0_9HEMI